MGRKLLDCGDFNPNCAAKNQVVEADADIAGIGVIVGFLSTTCLAFLIAFTVIFLDRYERIVNFHRRWIFKNKEVYQHNYDEPYWRSPAFWSRVLSKNLLALADTQLLTGLAIQFTAMLKHCRLTIYHFQIVTDLAFLTTITHLLTVVALRNYFVKNRWINLPRIFFMLSNLALLGYTSFVAYSYDLVGLDLSMSLACFFKGNRPPFKGAFGGKWAALLVGAIGGHVTVILAMYWFKDPKENTNKKWWWYVGAAFRTWIVAPIYSIYGIWMAGDGLRNTQALGKPNVTMEGNESQWNFGQFLPILLLALPIFAGWESFWEEKDEDRDNRFGRHSFRTSKGGTSSQLNMIELQVPNPASSERRRSSRDASVEEQEVESDGTSSANTPRHLSRSRVRSAGPTVDGQPSTSPNQNSALGSSSLLSVPSPAVSPRFESESSVYAGRPPGAQG
ncbi:uncharacterized protein K460DRAFT_296435 [Cucurbitaria berberidis CBS 394.84]|uniref:Uncharacterized protein n=1 Tax=Cucurbitaria berberidis CBS 394.84 TaxID=1168544 RepID=A0A9P4L3I3_9PLEO|nr:uncharacterized protein K460DRAFT_296435 [Cucurbitaria berberidis CBS 394.84]KAF1840425.1 hypothetical protein K460DRAFT_296435 [Cucurbitaria berberidis CBS 394.84]